MTQRMLCEIEPVIINFKNNEVTSFDDTSERSLKEWLIVEGVSNIVVPDGVDKKPIEYFCEQEGIAKDKLGDHPMTFGLTINGHVIELGNQMLFSIIKMYGRQHEQLKNNPQKEIDIKKEFTVVRELIDTANQMLAHAKSIDDSITSAEAKGAYEDEIQITSEFIKEFTNYIGDK